MFWLYDATHVQEIDTDLIDKNELTLAVTDDTGGFLATSDIYICPDDNLENIFSLVVIYAKAQTSYIMRCDK
jgi:hypothetical protein